MGVCVRACVYEVTQMKAKGEKKIVAKNNLIP